ncbi:MAG TPA: hypothetical protein PLB89_12985 [Flavobacteriales bacterium]|nr:hypothetical protein [Flavobacteriales bacterium]
MGGTGQQRLMLWGIPAVLFLSAVWMMWTPSFPTLDGWTHLHTSRLLFDGHDDGVYCSNPAMVPNRVGHLVLGALQLVLPALVAERVLLAIIILGIGLGALALSRAFGAKGGGGLVLLVLPFTVNFLLVLGFHNFLLGFGMALLLAAWWVALERIDWWRTLVLLFCTLLLFYTHTMALVLFLLVAGTHECTVLIGLRQRIELRLPGARIKAMLLFILPVLPAIVLFLLFNATQRAEWGMVDRSANLRQLMDLQSLVLYGKESEEKFTYAVKLLLIAGFGIAIVGRARSDAPWKPRHCDVPLSIGVLLLVLYFVLPDSSGYASYITLRLQLMALVLLITWMAAQPNSMAITSGPVVMILLLHSSRSTHISETMAPLAERRDQLLQAADQLPNGAIVLPISTEDNWLLGHASSLLAVEREVTLLDNYECNTGYFPLVWCSGLPDALHAHVGGGDRCLGWLQGHIQQNATPRIDRIVLFGYAQDTISCGAKNLNNVLAAYFHQGYSNAYAKVYERLP